MILKREITPDYYKVDLTALVIYAGSPEVSAIAACRIADEIKDTEVHPTDRCHYEHFLNRMGLSLSMLPWKMRVETFEDRWIR